MANTKIDTRLRETASRIIEGKKPKAALKKEKNAEDEAKRLENEKDDFPPYEDDEL